jgi:hypothetical protein
MPRLLAGTTLTLALALLACAQEPKPPTVADIMKEANKPTGLYFGLMKELALPRPDWADAADDAKQLTALMAALTKTRAAKGDAASWTSLTADYLAQTKALEQAVLKKDKAAALAAGNRLGGATCKKCHDVHR